MNSSPARPRDRFGLAPLCLYAAFSLIVFGRGLTPGSSFVGITADPTVYMWFLVWWPHAIASGLNPFVTDLVWAPAGFNLTWTTGIPLAGLLAAPLTLRYGPLAAYSVLCLAAPALAAWTAFLLCRRVSARFWPAIAGGYLFGFSPYVLSELRSHLPLILIFPVPLVVLLVLRRLDDEIRATPFVLLMAVVMATAFLLWLELFATMTFFAAIAFAIALALGDAQSRRSLYSLIPQLALAYLLTAILVLPYLYYFFRPGFPHSPVNSPGGYSADLLNFIVPGVSVTIGNLSWLARIPPRTGSGEYLGIPLIVIASGFIRARWTERSTRLLAWFILIVVIASLGPRLHVGGVELFGLPWKLIQRLPLIKNALPERFSMFAFLAIAVILSRWLGDETISRTAKAAGLGAMALFLAPNPSARFWVAPAAIPSFFTSGSYREVLAPGDTVLILPYGASGSSMLWQAESDMYFRMAGGWTSITPREYQEWPAFNALMYRSHIPGFNDQLRAFLANHQVTAIIVADAERALWEPMLAPLGAPIATGGVAIYRLDEASLAPWRNVTALEMERRADAARFDELLHAANAYLAGGGDPALLTPRRAETSGLLPPHSSNDSDVRTSNGLFLGPLGGGLIGVGVVGSYEALRPLIARYRADAARVYFPYPRELSDPPHGETFMRQLVIVFDRAGLVRATARSAEEVR